MSEKRGITLIALVVSIVILLILTGISLNALIGENGILHEAIFASEKTKEARLREDLEFAWSAAMTRYYEDFAQNPNVKKSDYFTKDMLNELLKGKGEIVSIINRPDGEQIVKYKDASGTIYEVSMSSDGKVLSLARPAEVTYDPSEELNDPETNVNEITLGYTLPASFDVWDGETVDDVVIENPDDPIKRIHIYTAAQLRGLAESVNYDEETYEDCIIYLENNLDFGARKVGGSWVTEENEEIQWYSIGYGENSFQGIFDGQGHTIKGLYMYEEQGLFGIIENGEIKNLNIADSFMKGSNDNCGIFCGEAHNSKISNLIASNCTIRYNDAISIGGIVGYINESEIADCKSATKITNKKGYDTGGVIGDSYYSKISRCGNFANIKTQGGCYTGGVIGYSTLDESVDGCYNKGNIEGFTSSRDTEEYYGGISGYINEAEIVSNSFNEGIVYAKGSSIGGIAGCVYSEMLFNLHNTGSVTGFYTVGGIAGEGYVGTVENCYNTGTITSTSESNYGTAGIIAYMSDMDEYYSCMIKSSYNSGEIKSQCDNAAGIIGYYNTMHIYDIGIFDCYNTGKITSTANFVGGIIAEFSVGNNPEFKIERCYNAGDIEASGEQIGTILGYADVETESCNISDCYSIIISGRELFGDVDFEFLAELNARGEGDFHVTNSNSYDASVMQTQAFANSINRGTGNWKHNAAKNNGYPILSWQ